MARPQLATMASIESFIAEWQSDSSFIEAHTSGSTGTPKAILLRKSDMEASARATNARFGIDAASVLALPLSVDYIAGKMMVVRALTAGCRLVELPLSNEIIIPDDISRIDLLPVVPSQIQSLLRQPHLSLKIRNLLIGGAAPSPDDCHKLVLSGYNAFISYGMTETCSHVALAHADDSRRVFRAMPGITFETDDDGRLVINAPAFSFGHLLTNDLVTLLSPDAMIWRGRADGVINSGGIKLIPEELEALYRDFLGGYDFFVTGIKDDIWGEAVTLVIESPEDEADSIMRTLRQSIADHRRVPKSVIAVPELARTSNGKIRRML